MSSIKQQLLSGVFYTALAKYSGIIVSLVVAGVLARLISPDDFGIMAVATVIIAFFNLFTDVGLSPAIIQHKDLTTENLSDLFSFTIWTGIGLSLLFAAASLLIDTVRTFFLVVLSVLGPIAFAISVWDGFQSTLGQWFTRYISVYLWLPVSDLFSCMLAKIQVLMLQNDIAELQGNPDYSLDNSNCVYIIFMLIGIVGYFTVPTVSGWIVQAGGGGNYSRNLNRTATKAGGFTAGAGGAALGNIGGRIRGK